MTLFILAYLAGVLTIASPCILPILPFVLARADQPFKRSALPMLFGLALAFAGVASLAAVAGTWAAEVNSVGRTIALTLMTLFGLSMLFPVLASYVMQPFVLLGSILSDYAERRPSPSSSILLGIATGLIWAPCAGPILGLILTGAVLRGPNVETFLLLLAYGLGASTSLAMGVLFGRRLLALAKQSARWRDRVQRGLGAAVVAGAALIWFGLDVGLLTRLSTAGTNAIENQLISAARTAGGTDIVPAAHAAPPLSGPLRSVLSAPQWLNTEPLQPEDLRGKVVVVNFWTYSCINCLRALPYVRGWAEKYKDHGLVVVGVHTPEFAFEKNIENVRMASRALGVQYPVAIDNDFGIWRAFGNYAWPAIYFIGADGRVRDQMYGEGRYAKSERLIQELLSEARGARVSMDLVKDHGAGAQAQPDLNNLRSGEVYLGYAQASGFASPGGFKRDEASNYQPPTSLSVNRWSLAGVWTVGSEFASLKRTPGSIKHRFHARDVHLVLGPSPAGSAIRFRVTIDGAPPGENHGADVDAQGYGSVREERLYQLIRQTGPVAPRTFEIEFLDPGVRAYAFTFG